ncbi:MAG: agmatine deiminase family protein [Caulobacterales bacterium]
MTIPPIPAEWSPQQAIWTAWPSDPMLWAEDLDQARDEVAAMVAAIVEGDTPVRILAHGKEAVASARKALGAGVTVFDEPFGDIWLRDTGPIFRTATKAAAFRFNGWGGKYVLDHDDTVAARIAAHAGAALSAYDIILEGGAIEMDGQGTLITTRQCLLNPNRNSGWTQTKAEAALAAALGVRKVIWLGDGMQNDHTDGHVDNLARFAAPGHVVCQAPFGADDPNTDVFAEIEALLRAAIDAAGAPLQVTAIPSPGRIEDEDGDAIPASHMNFIIANRAVVVPVYSGSGDDAVRALAPLFPGRKVVGLSAHALLTGGGSFHCITQQQPA